MEVRSSGSGDGGDEGGELVMHLVLILLLVLGIGVESIGVVVLMGVG